MVNDLEKKLNWVLREISKVIIKGTPIDTIDRRLLRRNALALVRMLDGTVLNAFQDEELSMCLLDDEDCLAAYPVEKLDAIGKKVDEAMKVEMLPL